MQEISANLQTLLKNKIMVGANAPTAILQIGEAGIEDVEFQTIEGMESAVDYRIGYDDGTSDYKKRMSNIIQRTDGVEIMAVLNESTYEIYIGSMADNEDYFKMNYPISTIWSSGISLRNEPAAYYQSPLTLYKRPDGKLLLFVSDQAPPYGVGTLDVYISNNGLGTDFVHLSNLYTSEAYQYQNATECNSLCVMDNYGHLWITALVTREWVGDAGATGAAIFKSSDLGETWTMKHMRESYSLNTISVPVFLNDGTIFYKTFRSSYDDYYIYSLDGGEVWIDMPDNRCERFNNLWPEETGYISIGGFYYDRELDILYGALCGVPFGSTGYYDWHGVCIMINPTLDRITDVETGHWDKIINLPTNGGYHAFIYPNFNGNFIIHSTTSWDEIVGAQLIPKLYQPVPIKNVKIDKEQSALSQRLSAEIPNVKGSEIGYYTPFRGIDNPGDANEYKNVIMPGADVLCQMGYGDELTQTFTGAIDDVDISADGGGTYSIAIECRDEAWKILDTTVTSELGYYILYQNQTIEYMIEDLLKRAGISADNIILEETGINIGEIAFDKCSYADAIDKLLDICGYELVCNELGIFNFTKPKNPDPLVVAYEFEEGIDIVKMGLKITRTDVYARVQVTSKIDPDEDDEEGEPYYIVKEYVYDNAYMYGIPNHKTLFVDVENITDEIDLQTMADQIGYEMTRRLITVDFACVPVFQLQIGDIITVNESSTTISENYRITAMNMEVTEDGKASMNLKCHHYGEAASSTPVPIPSDPPETPEEGNIFFTEDFESGLDYDTKWTWWQDENIESTVVETIPLNDGNVLRCYTGDGDGVHRPRAEIYNNSNAHTMPDGADKDYWYEWKMYISENFDSNDKYTILGQWHCQDSGGDRSFAVALRMNCITKRVWVASGEYCFTDSDWYQDGVGITEAASNAIYLKKGVWYWIKFHIRWAADGTGYVECWLNDGTGAVSLLRDGRLYGNTMYDANGVYYKVGIYRYDENSYGPTEVFYDDIKFYTVAEE